MIWLMVAPWQELMGGSPKKDREYVTGKRRE